MLSILIQVDDAEANLEQIPQVYLVFPSPLSSHYQFMAHSFVL